MSFPSFQLNITLFLIPFRSVMGFLSLLRGPGAAQPLSPSAGPPRFVEHPRIPSRAKSSLPRTGRHFHRILPPTALSFLSFPIYFEFDFLFSLLFNLSPRPRWGWGRCPELPRRGGGSPELRFRSRRGSGGPGVSPGAVSELWGHSPQRRWGSHLSPRPQHFPPQKERLRLIKYPCA